MKAEVEAKFTNVNQDKIRAILKSVGVIFEYPHMANWRAADINEVRFGDLDELRG